MKITRKSDLTGIEHTKEIDVTQEQLDTWKNGELIQKVMPHLSDNDREFIMTGITTEEWDKAFPEEIDLPDPPDDFKTDNDSITF